MADWNNVMLSNDVNSAFDCFWSTYSTMYKQAFPLKRKRFNKNFNGINKFMTAGLLVSRRTKDKLHLLAVSDPLPMNINKYKAYKSVYQRTIRAAKKLHISNKITANAKNPKKTWQTLNEIMGKSSRSETVSQIRTNGVITSDSLEIDNQFNQFFTNVGTEISNSVPPVAKRPEDYINYGRQIPTLNLTNTTPEHLLKIIKKFQPKNSVDIWGVSTRMIKAIGPEIVIPIAHIFNLSLSTGNFPSKLKECRVIPIFKTA
jgi:hypothetical protein